MPELLLSQPFRELAVAITRSRLLRYMVIRPIITLILGPTPKYSTLYELNMMAHILAPVGFKTQSHITQILKARRLQRFDFEDAAANTAHYGQPQPPEFNLRNVRPANWLVVSSEHDPFSTRQDVQDFVSKVGRKPYRHLFVRRANHIDLIYMTDNDHVVNMPVLKFFDRFPLESNRSLDHTGQMITVDLPDRSRRRQG